MEVVINKEIIDIIPSFKLGIIVYNDIVISESPAMIKGRLQLYQESLALEFDVNPINEYIGVNEWRQTFKKLGMDPSKYRPSHEALLRRIAKRHFLASIHSAADINNFFSVQYGIPIGIYDLNNINGGIEIRLGRNSESFNGLNNREIHAESKIVSVDNSGPFGSPFVDSVRTAVHTETTNALQIVYLRPSILAEEALELLQAMSKMFTQVNGGNSQILLKHH